MNPWGYGLRDLRRRRRRTASVERVTRVGAVRHLRCRRLPSPLLHFSTGSPFGHHPRLRIVCPRWGQWVQAGRFLFSLPLHSPSPLLHFFTSPRVHPSGITRGYAWCVPSGDSGCGLGGFSFLSLSTLHSPLSTSPRVHPSGITRGYAWCVPAGDSEWTMSLFLLLPRKTNSGEECVFS